MPDRAFRTYNMSNTNNDRDIGKMFEEGWRIVAMAASGSTLYVYYEREQPIVKQAARKAESVGS